MARRKNEEMLKKRAEKFAIELGAYDELVSEQSFVADCSGGADE